VTCLAIIGLQLIFLITSDALTNLRNDGNDKQRDERRRMTAGDEEATAAAACTVATALRVTGEDGRGGKRKRRTRGSYL
jgi:hypothetical protein